MNGILREGLTSLQGEVLDFPYSSISGFEEMIRGEIDDAVEEASLLGYLDDPELMGSWITDLAKKVGTTVKKIIPKVKLAIQKIKAKRQETRAMLAPTVDTSQATNVSTISSPKSIMDNLKNPMVLGGIGIAALVIILVISKKKKRK